MARVFIPVDCRQFTAGRELVEVCGETVRELIVALEKEFPGIAGRLCHEQRLRPGLSVVVNSRVSSLGLREPVNNESEIQFLPTISGG